MSNVNVSELQGPLTELLQQFSGEKGRERFDEFKLWLKKVTTSGLLKFVCQTSVKGAKRFVAKDHLRAASVGWMGDNFKQFFLNLVEENVGEGTINVHRLEKASLNASIMTELGKRKQIWLTHFFELVEEQSKGEKGLLLTDGSAIIAYIIGSDGNFWAVCARWLGASRCWSLGASSVGGPYRWRGAPCVLSRDS